MIHWKTLLRMKWDLEARELAIRQTAIQQDDFTADQADELDRIRAGLDAVAVEIGQCTLDDINN